MSLVLDGSAGMTTAIGAVYNGIQSATAKTSALAKLTALGLSEDEVKALVG